MATITRAQAEKWTSKLANGFEFDLHHFLMHSGEKQATKDIPLQDGRKLQANLLYMEHYESRYTRTGLQQPTLHLSIWSEKSGFMSSSGLGKFLSIGTLQKKKSFDALCKLSATIDDETILTLAEEHMGQLNNPFIM